MVGNSGVRGWPRSAGMPCRNELGQQPHVGEDGGAGTGQSRGRGDTAGIREDVHPGRPGRLDAVGAVLDDGAPLRCGAEVPAACRNRSGAGLPLATSVALKIRPSKRCSSPVCPSVRCILAWLPLEATQCGSRKPVQGLHDAVDRHELALERRPVPGLVLPVPALGQLDAQLLFDGGDEVRLDSCRRSAPRSPPVPAPSRGRPAPAGPPGRRSPRNPPGRRRSRKPRARNRPTSHEAMVASRSRSCLRRNAAEGRRPCRGTGTPAAPRPGPAPRPRSSGSPRPAPASAASCSAITSPGLGESSSSRCSAARSGVSGPATAASTGRRARPARWRAASRPPGARGPPAAAAAGEDVAGEGAVFRRAGEGRAGQQRTGEGGRAAGRGAVERFQRRAAALGVW